jgi:predicted secreted protein
MTRSVFIASLLVVMWLALSGHVGSPNVVFDGSAGPYAVRVIVQPPNVVPGLAEVIVRVNTRDARRVLVQPVFWRTGVNGAPPPDEAKRVAGETTLFASQVWLMSRGAYSVYVTVDGGHGTGRAIVPVTALATQRLGLSPALGGLLIALGLLLFAGLVTIVRAAAGESVLPPGQTIDAPTKRRANRVALVVTPLFALLVFGGAKWWNAVDAQYRRTMYRPPSVTTVVRGDELTLRVRDTAAFRAIFAPVIPDHGKMMHLFLIETGAHARFGHFHPVQTDSLVFTTRLAGWPRGDYRVFGDILLENGSSQTVTTTLHWPGDATSAPKTDADDSSWPTCCPEPGSIAEPARLGEGYLMIWAGQTEPLLARHPIDLRFDVENEAGEIAHLTPYLGMAAHAVVLSADESVFVHLHPMGTVSTDAQQAFLARDRGDSTASGRLRLANDIMTNPMQMDGRVRIPYEFPKPGRYRVWVQVHPQNATRVLTGAFDFDVH